MLHAQGKVISQRPINFHVSESEGGPKPDTQKGARVQQSSQTSEKRNGTKRQKKGRAHSNTKSAIRHGPSHPTKSTIRKNPSTGTSRLHRLGSPRDRTATSRWRRRQIAPAQLARGASARRTAQVHQQRGVVAWPQTQLSRAWRRSNWQATG